jgi:hypothetical protein
MTLRKLRSSEAAAAEEDMTRSRGALMALRLGPSLLSLLSWLSWLSEARSDE